MQRQRIGIPSDGLLREGGGCRSAADGDAIDRRPQQALALAVARHGSDREDLLGSEGPAKEVGRHELVRRTNRWAWFVSPVLHQEGAHLMALGTLGNGKHGSKLWWRSMPKRCISPMSCSQPRIAERSAKPTTTRPKLSFFSLPPDLPLSCHKCWTPGWLDRKTFPFEADRAVSHQPTTA